jgi:hypothetical protein
MRTLVRLGQLRRCAADLLPLAFPGGAELTGVQVDKSTENIGIILSIKPWSTNQPPLPHHGTCRPSVAAIAYQFTLRVPIMIAARRANSATEPISSALSWARTST